MERQYEINREEIIRRTRFQPGTFPPKFKAEPYANTNSYYTEGYTYPLNKNNTQGGPMRRTRDSKVRSNPYGSKPAYPNVKLDSTSIGEFLGPLSIHMRGLPYSANEKDVQDFFAPIRVAAVKIHTGPDGKASGEAEADFFSEEDVVRAMEKDRCKMSWRYIELFRGSTPATC